MAERTVDKCPHCSRPLNISLFAKAEAESSLTLVITPKSGSYLGLTTVAKSMLNMEQLVKACGRELGVRTTVFLKDAAVENNGIKVEIRRRGEK